MNIIEKTIYNKNKRFIQIQCKTKNLFYIINLIRKKCIYFDYVIVYDTQRYNSKYTIYNQHFMTINIYKYISKFAYRTPELDILKYEKHPDYIKYKRETKLERILK